MLKYTNVPKARRDREQTNDKDREKSVCTVCSVRIKTDIPHYKRAHMCAGWLSDAWVILLSWIRMKICSFFQLTIVYALASFRCYDICMHILNVYTYIWMHTACTHNILHFCCLHAVLMLLFIQSNKILGIFSTEHSNSIIITFSQANMQLTRAMLFLDVLAFELLPELKQTTV